jgi:hypothetical protein
VTAGLALMLRMASSFCLAAARVVSIAATSPSHRDRPEVTRPAAAALQIA